MIQASHYVASLVKLHTMPTANAFKSTHSDEDPHYTYGNSSWKFSKNTKEIVSLPLQQKGSESITQKASMPLCGSWRNQAAEKEVKAGCGKAPSQS
jgi:hypothetical protein